MSFAQKFEQGMRYIGGANRPFVVSKGAIKSWAEGKGFTNVIVQDRSDLPNKTVPFQVSSDDWDAVVSADHLGPTEVIELPAEPAWLLAGPAAAASPPSTPGPSSPGPSSPGPAPVVVVKPASMTQAQAVAIWTVLGVLVVAGVAGGAYYMLRRRKGNTRSSSSSTVLRNPAAGGDAGGVVQSVLLDRRDFDERAAAEWARRYGFRVDELDASSGRWRFQQRPPRDFEPSSFRTIQLTRGVQAIVARPK